VTGDDHWIEWHARYEDPGSSLSRRLAVVQRRLAQALDEAAGGPVRLISICAGQGRDVIGVLSEHKRAGDVAALLVELDPVLAGDARALASAAGLDGVHVVIGDASATASYAGAVPADVLLVCGVFGNISEDDMQTTIRELPHLAAPGATVIWTRHRRPPDVTPALRAWFRDAGFQELAFDTDDGAAFGVGTARLLAPPLPFRPDGRLFTFHGDGADAHF
jgi:hypothetical protein